MRRGSLVAIGVILMAAAIPAAAREALSARDTARAFEQAIQQTAERVGPSVVNIVVTREPAPMDEGALDPGDVPPDLRDRLREYFDQFRDGVPFRTQGNGSGFVIRPDGYILTNEHVVHGAGDIEVTLTGRKRYKAEVVGADPRRDLAVIRIDAEGLPAVRLGDARELHRGQFVLALGSPFGFGRDGQPSLSFGVVSGLGRVIHGVGDGLDRYYGNLVQSDAAINPGNSGGPLVTLDGEVVGVNAVISSTSGASEGVGFAIPITDRTRAIVDRLVKGEAIEYGFLGVEMRELTPDFAEEINVEPDRGAYVLRVLPDTPAAEGGLRTGDIIIEAAGETIDQPDDLVQIVQATPVGEAMPLTILRGKKTRTVTVATTRRPAPEDLMAAFQPRTWWRGLRVEPLTEAVREEAGLEPQQQGVVVREVRDGSPAAKAGIAPGMVIDQVGDRRVGSVRAFEEAVDEFDKAVFVHVFGQGVKVIQPE